MELFTNQKQTIPLKKAKVTLVSNFLNETNALLLLDKLKSEVNWEQNRIKLFGKEINEPRLTAFYAKENLSYTYSKTKRIGLAFPAYFNEVLQAVNEASGTNFNSCLLNFYRDGQDSMGWHCDNEPELGKNPVVASLSLGEARPFHVKAKKGDEKHKFILHNGGLLLMHPGTQEHYLHQIPKSKKRLKERISLTFRAIKAV